MRRIGITGSIATGKSTLLAAFAKAGVPVLSADDVVAELYAGPAIAPVEALFPGVAKHGRIDRQDLARRLAADPSGFARLEAVVHPLVRERIAQFLTAAETAGEALAAVEVPLLFESGHDYDLDAIAVTHVDETIQQERILARPGMDVDKMQTMLARQLPQAEKMKRATWLFDTAQPRRAIDDQVAELVAGIRAETQA
ncbi:dephospho-CoA kinase [Devosia sp. YIM 151766]|uniref:dephospho-CoA kinase n=1 Tax=Devosia sp. YIM 151766 TaxID=3017325 RepID=UPI00255CFF24|nr:dephospho-CoA kinase [Devosia sp. YIM 151766]WIY52832.1 dephospho-CoA kinase [Devosia sp. YIM 151766]